jgi:exodeoxyribonuclease VII small subunit
VSKAAKAGASPDLPFEEALKKLESVVETMESDELPLEQLLAKFEEGTRLVQVCQTRLAEAEVKVQKLEQDLAGELALKPVTVGEGAAVAA